MIFYSSGVFFVAKSEICDYFKKLSKTLQRADIMAFFPIIVKISITGLYNVLLVLIAYHSVKIRAKIGLLAPHNNQVQRGGYEILLVEIPTYSLFKDRGKI